MAFAGTKSGSTVKIVGDYETVGGVAGVVVYYVNDDILPERDIHYGPWIGMVSASVVANIDSFVGLHNSEYCCVGLVGRANPAICLSCPKEVKCIAAHNGPGHYYHDSHYGQNPS